MHRVLLPTLSVAIALGPAAAPATKEQLSTPPAGARHFTITSTAGKHGDIWSWKTTDGRVAYRMSMSLRGWVTEEDEFVTLGADRRPTVIAIRGYTDQGDATEDFTVDGAGVAHWKTAVDSGAAPFGTKRYNAYGGPWLDSEVGVGAVVAAGDKGIELLPSGHASISFGPSAQIDGPRGPKTVKLAFLRGYSFSPSPVWLDSD